MERQVERCAYCGIAGEVPDLLTYYTWVPGAPETHTLLHERCSVLWHEEWRAREMAFEHKDNTGSLFRNDRREKETHPTHTGQGKIDGVDYWISAWVKEANGLKFFSMAFKPKDGQQPRSRQPGEDDDLGDDGDIPF